jgi:hypothetical protein
MYYEDRLSGGGFAKVFLTGATGEGVRHAGDVDLVRRSLQDRLAATAETVDPRLAAALTDRISAGPALLDSYESERVPVAQRLLSTTDRIFSLIVSDNWLAGMFRTRILANVMAVAMGFGGVQRLAFRTISQTGIRYPDSPLSETGAGLPEGAPRAGDRFPWLRLKLQPNGPVEDLFAKLDDTRFNLILFGQPSASAALPGLGDLLRLLVVPSDGANDTELARAQVPQPSFYLLRPDGHVGLAGTQVRIADITRYVAGRLRIGNGT